VSSDTVYEPDRLPFAPLAADGARVVAAGLERAAGKAFADANRRGQEARKNRFALSMSGLGGCAREAAYRLAGTEPDDGYVERAGEDEARAAMLGTWAHDGLLPGLATLLGEGRWEMPVTLTVPLDTEDGVTRTVVIEGTTDCYTPSAGGGIIDAKTLGAYRLGDIAALGPKERHRIQVRGYASAAIQQGLPVAWIALLYLDRSDGEVKAVVEPFGRTEYLETLELVRTLHAGAADPDYAPRTEHGPGLSVWCDACPFLRRCWGPWAVPGDKRAVAVHDDQALAYAASRVVELGEEIGALTKQRDWYKAQAGQPPAGQYGAYTVTYGKDGQKPDDEKMMARLEELGEPIPMVPRAGNQYFRRAVVKKKDGGKK